MTQYIKKLPAVFQTVTEKKFFDATFDQVFSKKDSDLLYGYIGQRIPGQYKPVTDFYLPEPSKDRTWWQLEATAFSKNADSTKSNIFFYDDLLNRINYYGGNTLNQDRLFESEYYSWAPPIDFDMFMNYQNYYWVENGLVKINITGITDEQIAEFIIGQPSFNTSEITGATPANLTFSTGMKVQFVGSTVYPDPVTVENFGSCKGIGLVPQFLDYTSGTVLELLPWDGTIQLANGRIIQNTNWDTLTWDAQPEPGNGDYITIERGAADQNAWSRTNRWVHISTISATIAATGTAFPVNSSRALRPIIQFSADLILYNSGTQFKSTIDYGFKDTAAGNTILLSQVNGQTQGYIDTLIGTFVQDSDIVIFMDDTAIEGMYTVNRFVYLASVDINTSIVVFSVIGTVVENGDIIFATANAPDNGAQRGQTWYFNVNSWVPVANDKISINQAPLFQLYDHNGIELDNEITYPDSTFAGNKIFSYKVNTAPGASVDPVLKFPIVYTSLGQTSDIIFQNNLITDRCNYGPLLVPVDGYYYYKMSDSPVLYNSWNLYSPCPCDNIVPPPPCNCIGLSKQRVIDKFVVGYGTEYQFKLSVTPYGYPASPDLVVSVNGIEVKDSTVQSNGYTLILINNDIYVDLQEYLTALLSVTQVQPPVVEVDTYTHGLLAPEARGYFEIPQQLNANPTQLEVSDISAGNLYEQFSSIIENQIGSTGVAFGGDNNYRDSRKNRSVGSFILQNVAPTLKSMLVSSENDLDIITGIRFSQEEYTKFKNKYLRTAKQLIDQEFSPLQYHNNTVVVSAWVDAIIKTVNVSKEFSNAFAYSYMIANGAPYIAKTYTVPVSGLLTLDGYLDLADPRNALYVYDTSGQEHLLMVGIDYEIISTNLAIDIQFDLDFVGSSVYVALYRNPLPAYIPSTPTKVGAYSVYIPRIELDTSYTIPTNVIIGHDGSKTIAYGDYRDQLLLELETRIYNLLQYRFRNEYYLPLRLEDIKSGYFRQTRYTRAEFLEITESYLNKWSAKNKANYRVNDWAYASANLPTDSAELWKLYNYATAVATNGDELNLPGNWKGIFQFYYDTIYPDSRPWEMLGFTAMPIWWLDQYGIDWSSTNTALWNDLEAGIIRQGPSAIFDPVTLLPQPQDMWARPGLSGFIPVDAAGEIIPVPTLFNVLMSGNLYAPFDGFDNPWVYGDGGPVEQAWMSTSGYVFSIQEFLYLMKPGPFGELLFDTLGTELSPGKIEIAGVVGPVMSNTNWQYVQNDTFTSSDPFFAWMRPKNIDQIVHAEIVDGVTEIRYGYQRWISDRILFLGKNVSDTFGQKVRTLDVNLANKLAGFTNKDTTSMYIESVSVTSNTASLLIPTNNFDVILHKGQPIKTYSYSGVIVRALENGTFVVYGYDLLNSAFTVLNRSNAQLIDVTIGGTPAEFKTYTLGETYYPGDIVRYNGVYYLNIATLVAGKFDATNWQKLRALPTTGGVSVTYRPISETTSVSVPYGSVLDSAQEVFDLLIGWGAYLETQGWEFKDVNSDTNQISDWLYSAKQFLFWLNTNWAPDASIQLSPAANTATLVVQGGYPDDVETISNGIYSILDKYGVAIPPGGTSTDRDGPMISVSPVDLSVGGIYFLQVNSSETEHILIFDNTTSFSDVIYSPLLRARQQRLRFNGFRSNGWYGKKEAPGYLIIDNQLVPNFDTIVDSMRYFYDPDVTIDNPSLESLGRHLIGYESKSYLDNLQVSNDVQYLFYQGAIRQKGTKQALDKLFRSDKIQSNEIIEIYEEWALKLGDFGNTIEQVSTEFILEPEQNTGEVIVARLNFVPSPIGFVKEINIVNSEEIFVTVPAVVISAPDAAINDSSLTQPIRQAKAYAILDSAGIISRVDITDPGYGYLTAPTVSVVSGGLVVVTEILYSVWQGEIYRDASIDNIIDIDIDDTSVWTVRPPQPEYSLEFPTTAIIEYGTPNAGYVNFDDVTWHSFDVTQTAIGWGTTSLNPTELDTVWVAKTFTEDWDVYKMVNFMPSTATANTWQVIEDASGSLLLLTPSATNTILTVEPQPVAEVIATLANGYVSSIQVTLGGSGYVAAPAVTISAPPSGVTATAIATIEDGTVIDIVITDGGSGYTSIPTVTISASPAGITALAATEILASIGTISVVNGGGFYTSIPDVVILGSSTAAEPASAIATVVNGVITGITVTDPGAGYTEAPTVTIDDTTNELVVAELDAVVDVNGSITGVVFVIDAEGNEINGSGYTVGATVVATRALPYDSAYVDAEFEITSVGTAGEILSISVLVGGTGYESVPSQAIVPQLSTEPGNQTDFGNMICLQVVNDDGTVPLDTNYAVTFADNGLYAEPTTLIEYNSYSLLTLDGNPITVTDIGDYADFTDLLLFKTMKFESTPAEMPTYVLTNDKVWIDNVNSLWNVSIYNASLNTLTPYRIQENLIDTKLFENSRVFQTRTQAELVLMPVYDPFKNILPAPAKQNITYMLLQDPAKYNVTGDVRLFSENITFGEAQVGKLWWDLSEVRYTYYEQPRWLDSDGNYGESATDNLVYRRDRWGQLFPGSTVDVYEWTKSPLPPELYTGSGIPRSTTTYVQIETSNRFTNITETNYYFWVLNPTDKPNIENRTLAALEVSRMLSSPKGQGFVFFAPIQQTSINNSYMFYNVQEILAYKGNNVQVQYRLSTRDDQEHTQWRFFREGDSSSLVTDQFWNKMVDSLCGYTEPLPASDEWYNGIILSWENTPDLVILPVPDPSLSNAEKYGITYRPRQGMFVNIYAARKVFVQAGNTLLKYIPIRDDNPGWNTDVESDIYWEYTNWYEVGYEDATPSVVFSTLTQAQTALSAGELSTGTIVEVIDGTADGRFILYKVIEFSSTSSVQSFKKIAVELSAIKLLDTIYTVKNIYNLSTSLRELLVAIRTKVFINAYIVDQNELYFSMMNYVLSEQKNPNWLFKSSYIYIKENNIPLEQTTLYLPDQIDNVINYIIDAKPYHTQIRDYTSTYLASDIANGTATDTLTSKTIITFGPTESTLYVPDQNVLDAIYGWDLSQGEYVGSWDGSAGTLAHNWDTQVDSNNNLLTMNRVISQYVSGNPSLPTYAPVTGQDWPELVPIELTFYDANKVGLSALYPYTFDLSTVTLDNPQSFITPTNIILIKVGDITLNYGQGYYVEYNNTTANYTAYFFEDPGSIVPVAYILFDGGQLMNLQFDGYRNELAIGFPGDDFVVNVDTKLPVNNTAGVTSPYVGWGDIWEATADPAIVPLIDTPEIAWDAPMTLELLPDTISFKENLTADIGQEFYRNSSNFEYSLYEDLPVPTLATNNVQTIRVYVDPATGVTIPQPGPGDAPAVIWINGERIEYQQVSQSVNNPVANVWDLSLVRRGTRGTAIVFHAAASKVWGEKLNVLPDNAVYNVWNAFTTPAGQGTDVNNVVSEEYVNGVFVGGLWYARTDVAEFLKDGPGSANNS